MIIAVNSDETIPAISVTAKPLMGPGKEIIQDRTRQEGCDIRVNDSTHGVGITAVNCGPHTLTRIELFTYTFKYEHVGINRHTDSQHDTSNTGQCKGT